MLRPSINSEARKILKAICQPNQQNLVEAVSTHSLLCFRCHGYWAITTVSWEPSEHFRSYVTQRENGYT